MKKNLLTIFVIVSALSLAACGSKGEIENTPVEVEESSTELSTPEEVKEEQETVEENDSNALSDEELNKINEFLKEPYNYGFLRSSYSDVRDANVAKILYNGDVVDGLTEAESEKLWESYGHDVEGGDLFAIKRETATRVLEEKTGYSLEEFSKYYDIYYSPWLYDYDMEVFYHFSADIYPEKYTAVSAEKVGDVIVARVVMDEVDNYMTRQGFRDVAYELALEPYEDSYRFVSNRPLIDEGLITEFCFETVINPIGSSYIFTYEPLIGDFDYTIKVINKGEICSTIHSNTEDNILRDRQFLSVEDMALDDYNNDGFIDIVSIGKYITNGADEVTSIKVMRGDEEGFFTYDWGLNEFINEVCADETDAKKVIEVLKDQKLDYVDWKSTYLKMLESDEDYYMEGGALINLDDDNIPEIGIYGDCEASGSKMLCYANGEGQFNQFSRLYFTYMPGQGLLCNSEGHMGYYYDIVYQMQDTKLVEIAQGDYEIEYFQKEGEEEVEETLRYRWNNKEVTAEEYERNLEKVYDTEHNQTCALSWRRLMSREDLISLLKCEYTKVFE